MKSRGKKLVVACVTFMLALAMAIPAFAVTSYPIYAFQVVPVVNQYLAPKAKRNTSSAAVQLNETAEVHSVYVDVYGLHSVDGGKTKCNNGYENRTVSTNNSIVYLYNDVKENEFEYATLGFRSTGLPFSIAGYWWPDTSDD